MPDVGIRQLKERLSEYVERAAAGETVVVTDRGRPKAVLGPLPGRADLERGIAEGWVTPGSGRGLAARPRFRSRRRVADVLAEDRGE